MSNKILPRPILVISLAILLMISTILVGCGGGSSSQTINVSMSEFALNISPTTVSSGEVVFKVSNSGMLGHDFLLVSTAESPESLPYNEENAQIIEEQVTVVSSIRELQKGETAEITANLSPGKYMLICNIAGHFSSGMHLIIDVTAN